MMFDRPSENFLMSQSEMAHRQAEMRDELYKTEAAAEASREAEARRTFAEQNAKTAEYMNEQRNRPLARAKFLEAAKDGFVAAALYKVVKESMNFPLTPTDEATLKGMIGQFVEEQGAGQLLNRFKTQNVLLAEMGRICREAYQSTVQKLNEYGVEFDSYDTSTTEEKFVKERPVTQSPKPMADMLKLDTATVDKFYTDMDAVDTKRATKMIQDKVKDSINTFLDNNLETRIQCEEIMNDAKEKIAAAKAANGIPDTPAPQPEPPASEETPASAAPDEGSKSGNDETNPPSETPPDDLTKADKSSEPQDKPEEKMNGAPVANQNREPKEKPSETNKPEPQDNNKKEPTQESVYITDIKNQAKRRIHEIQSSRPKTPFHFMVESITKAALKDDALKAKFVTESSKVDMGGILHTAEMVYTMLEAFNTLEVVNEAWIKDYLKSLIED